ncbi:hypothetical protein Schulenberg_083 [Escherichia phage Schulenburg]|nr:hypothetical protein Schulenberg_083 [Escherichia phage Schulenburg]
MSRNIEYKGSHFCVWDNINYVATDEDGGVYGFEHEPVIEGLEWVWTSDNGEVQCLGCIENQDVDWKESLVRI